MNIFNLLDAPSYLHARQTCVLWNELVELASHLWPNLVDSIKDELKAISDTIEAVDEIVPSESDVRMVLSSSSIQDKDKHKEEYRIWVRKN